MRIVYGVSGEGFGHSSRAKEMISHLESLGHKVLVVTYGQAYSILKEQFNVLKIEGIHLYFENGKMAFLKTLFKGLIPTSINLRNFFKIRKAIEKFSPDIFITDFEPFTAMISYSFRKPIVTIDNQHRLTQLEIKIPWKYLPSYWITRIAVAFNPPWADAHIILSFTKQKTALKKAHLVCPILRKEIIQAKPKESNYILVYQTKPNEPLVKILKQIKENFIVYGYNKEKQEKNILFKKSGPHFIKDLASCKAVIATSGFSLMSEALFLKKPMFVNPLKGQFEQTLNALFLQQQELGEFSEEFTRENIENFLKNAKTYKKNINKYKMNPNEAFATTERILKHLCPED
jgi:uncharacterized protein (TIGR00661 family)